MLSRAKNFGEATIQILQSHKATQCAVKENKIESFTTSGANALLGMDRPKQCFEFLSNVEAVASKDSPAYVEAV